LINQIQKKKTGNNSPGYESYMDQESLMSYQRGPSVLGQLPLLDTSLGTQQPQLASYEPTKWVPNERFDSCQICTKLFGIFRRKHHCRACGVLVCTACSPDKEYVSGYKDTRVRVCRHCVATKLKRQTELKTQNIFISAANTQPAA
jgi:FYVE zinc finger